MNLKGVVARDVIAVIILALAFVGKFLGMNGYLDTTIALVVGYYFARRTNILKGE